MYVDESRIFYCIMTQGLETEDAKDALGVVVNMIYHYVKDTRAKLDSYKS